MAIALEIRVCDLLPEFLTDALIVLRPLQPTGAVASRALQTFPNGFYQFLVVIEPNRHHPTLPFREHFVHSLPLLQAPSQKNTAHCTRNELYCGGVRGI